MDIKILKPCVIDGKNHKPSKKKVTVSKRDGDVLVSLGKAEDLSPKKEELYLNMQIDPAALEEVKKEIESLKEQIVSKDEEIESLKEQIADKTEDQEETK